MRQTGFWYASMMYPCMRPPAWRPRHALRQHLGDTDDPPTDPGLLTNVEYRAGKP